ncbi:MAG: YlxR family protein [Clostridia bacterium]|nr:YlxR family protein [Clostridia bacterium]MBO5206296.1 YlxR family protein [Clostridia bacterium]MBP3584050.1 YlxR family protein [Clostridia bacterium]MBQ8584012.1 YlxR family protein [Clostridia bacterium]
MQTEIKRKIPTRRCTGCGEHFPKNTLIRVLRTPEGEIILDLTGKKSGRGAYICKNTACLKKARKAKRLETSLECPIPEEVYDRMEEELKVGQ